MWEPDTLARPYLEDASGDVMNAAVMFAQGLMAGDPGTHRQGYTLENAAIAASEHFPIERKWITMALEHLGREKLDELVTASVENAKQPYRESFVVWGYCPVAVCVEVSGVGDDPPAVSVERVVLQCDEVVLPGNIRYPLAVAEKVGNDLTLIVDNDYGVADDDYGPPRSPELAVQALAVVVRREDWPTWELGW